ncbi:MAG: hypothetical protein IKX00_04550 [Bacilli bacterium]|nr:hypothetical protein [Bacilli bacterium]
MKKKKLLIFNLSIVFLINIILRNYIGKLYLNKFNIFIKENNSIFLKKEINNIFKNSFINIPNDLYNVVYNDQKEIIDVTLDINKTNGYLSRYLKEINNKIDEINYSYLSSYYNTLKTNNNLYFLLPLGMISNNPFIYNLGPKVILYYDLLSIPVVKIDVKVRNYGLNNAIVDVYLLVHIDQSLVKPVLSRISSYDYGFLISSKIINGRVSTYLGTSLNVESGAVSN